MPLAKRCRHCSCFSFTRRRWTCFFKLIQIQLLTVLHFLQIDISFIRSGWSSEFQFQLWSFDSCRFRSFLVVGSLDCSCFLFLDIFCFLWFSGGTKWKLLKPRSIVQLDNSSNLAASCCDSAHFPTHDIGFAREIDWQASIAHMLTVFRFERHSWVRSRVAPSMPRFPL